MVETIGDLKRWFKDRPQFLGDLPIDEIDGDKYSIEEVLDAYIQSIQGGDKSQTLFTLLLIFFLVQATEVSRELTRYAGSLFSGPPLDYREFMPLTEYSYNAISEYFPSRYFRIASYLSVKDLKTGISVLSEVTNQLCPFMSSIPYMQQFCLANKFTDIVPLVNPAIDYTYENAYLPIRGVYQYFYPPPLVQVGIKDGNVVLTIKKKNETLQRLRSLVNSSALVSQDLQLEKIQASLQNIDNIKEEELGMLLQFLENSNVVDEDEVPIRVNMEDSDILWELYSFKKILENTQWVMDTNIFKVLKKTSEIVKILSGILALKKFLPKEGNSEYFRLLYELYLFLSEYYLYDPVNIRSICEEILLILVSGKSTPFDESKLDSLRMYDRQVILDKFVSELRVKKFTAKGQRVIVDVDIGERFLRGLLEKDD